MPVYPSQRRSRLPAGALFILLLSILLHLALFGSLGSLDLSMPHVAQPPPRSVMVQLQRESAPEARPVPAEPGKPQARPKKRKAPRPEPRPQAKDPAPQSPPVEAPVAVIGAAQPDIEGANQPPESAPDQAAETPSASTALDEDLPAANPSGSGHSWRAAPPPSAELRYEVKATRQGGDYHGSGSIRFVHGDGTYSVDGEAKLLFISVLDFHSSGSLEEQGLAPVLYTEKRFRRAATNTHFHRQRQVISFSASTISYSRRGDEQDRASIVWQLAALGRADAAQLAPGTELSVFVAGTRDGENWSLRVLGEEPLDVDGQQFNALHIVRHPRPGSYDQRLDIWLAPALEWYPVKLRFTESNGDVLDMSLSQAPQALLRN